MNRVPLQMELIPRKRVPLAEEHASPLRQRGESVLGMIGRREAAAEREPAATTSVYRDSPAALLFAIEHGAEAMLSDVEDLIGFTAWLTDRPPCSGFYEVRQKSARQTTTHPRVWFDADTQMWWLPAVKTAALTPITHAQLMMSHFWRGLKAPWPAYLYRVPGQRVRLLAD